MHRIPVNDRYARSRAPRQLESISTRLIRGSCFQPQSRSTICQCSRVGLGRSGKYTAEIPFPLIYTSYRSPLSQASICTSYYKTVTWLVQTCSQWGTHIYFIRHVTVWQIRDSDATVVIKDKWEINKQLIWMKHITVEGEDHWKWRILECNQSFIQLRNIWCFKVDLLTSFWETC